MTPANPPPRRKAGTRQVTAKENDRMDNERLREIKEDLETTIETHLAEKYVRWVKLYAQELIAALEASQEKSRICHTQYRMCCEERVTLRKQLAEAEERDDAMDKIGVADKRTITDLRSQLAASQAEVKRLGYENRVIRAAHDVPNGLSIIVPGAEKDEG